MTNKEFEEKVAQSTSIQWLNNVSVDFYYQNIDLTISLTGISSIYKYVDSQVTGWKESFPNLPSEFNEDLDYFDRIRSELLNFINNYSHQASNLDSFWQRVVNQISNYRVNVLPYNVPEAKFLIDIYKHDKQYFTGANLIIANNGSFNLNNRNQLFGAILAYEFLHKNHSDISNRRKVEKPLIAKLRNDFEKTILESDLELINHKRKLTDYSDSFIAGVEKLKEEKNASFESWFSKTKDEDWEKWYTNSVNNVKELEQVYKEKLKLEEPAKYWSERAKKLNRQGWISVLLILILVGVSCWSLSEILWKTPDLLYSKFFEGDKSAAIRWSVVYATLITFIAYCIRSLTKQMFSSFHLSRDCEERHTLTYFYLSLLKDSTVDEKDRQLIMQSLFSRADTGLLKEDSSPTMPSDFISRIGKIQ